MLSDINVTIKNGDLGTDSNCQNMHACRPAGVFETTCKSSGCMKWRLECTVNMVWLSTMIKTYVFIVNPS